MTLSIKEQKARQVLSQKKYNDRIAKENLAKGLTADGKVRAEPSAFFKQYKMTVKQMAKNLNMSENNVSRRFNSGQTVVKKSSQQTAFRKKYGMSYGVAARKVGVTPQTIANRFKRGQNIFAKKKN